jgi:hypothetical protein
MEKSHWNLTPHTGDAILNGLAQIGISVPGGPVKDGCPDENRSPGWAADIG